MRDLRGNQRGVLNWLWAVFGILAIVAFVVALFFFSTLIVTVILLLGGFAVIAFGPKPHSIWVGLAIILIAVLLYVLTSHNTLVL